MSNDHVVTGYGSTIYPNWQSYVMSGRHSNVKNDQGRPVGGGVLKKAVLYSATVAGGAINQTSGASVGSDFAGNTEIVTSLRKPFQFNPPSLIMRIGMAGTDSSDSAQSGGNLKETAYIGTAGTSVEMLFDRTAEVHAGKMNPGGKHSEYAKLGVAKDVLDVYAVLRGEPELLEASDDKSIANLTLTLTDLVSRGSQILMGHRAAISYSRDLVVYGLVTNMQFRFVKFNHELIPTFGFVDLTFDVHKATNTSEVRTEMVGEPGSTIDPDPTKRWWLPSAGQRGWG